MKSGQDHELKRILDEAFQAFEAGDDTNARRLCRDALAIDPDSGTAHSLLGLLYEREGKRGDATHEFSQVVSQSPRSEAERETLARMRGVPVDDDEFEEHRSNGPLIAIAALAALLVFGGIFAAFRSVNRWADDRSPSQRVATANMDDDLQLATEAFAAGRYETAMQAADRVLTADPDNPRAREIYDRSAAFLKGSTAQPPVARPAPSQTTPPQVVGPAQPADVRQQPAVPQPGATNPRSGASLPPVSPRQVLPTNGRSASAGPVTALPSISAPAGGNQRTAASSGQTAGQILGARNRPPVNGYDRTARPRDNTPRMSTPQRTPPSRTSYDQHTDTTTRADKPQGTTGTGDVKVEKSDSYVKVEVQPRNRTAPDEPTPEVTPDMSGGPATDAPSSNGTSTNPVVEDYQQRQQRLREFRARQKALESRRAEREQGQ